jgi:GTP cyclohydrolase II
MGVKMEDYLTGFVGSTATIESKKWGTLLVESASFTPALDGDLIIHVGRPFEQNEPIVRLHSICTFSEIFQSDLCDCGEQLELAMARLKHEGHGLLFYLRFEARGVGLAAKVKATDLEVKGMDTYSSRVAVGVPPENRQFTEIGKYLYDRGVRRVRLLTNNPLKIAGIADAGIVVTPEPLIVVDPNEKVRDLLNTKAQKFNHNLPGYGDKKDS